MIALVSALALGGASAHASVMLLQSRGSAVVASEPGGDEEQALLFTDTLYMVVGGFVTGYCDNDGDGFWVPADGDDSETVTYDGNDPTLCGEVADITAMDGTVTEVTTSTIAAAVATWEPGDVFYLRAGTYTGVIRTDGYNGESQFDVTENGGTPTQPIVICGYPGEDAFLQSGPVNGGRSTFSLGAQGSSGFGDGKASNLVICNLRIETEFNCIDSGAFTGGSTMPESGAANVRVVGIDCTITDDAMSVNSMTGMFAAIGGDDWKVLGNAAHDPANRDIINNNHAIYVQTGADNVELGWNDLSDLHMGFTIQTHQDGTPMLYTGLRYHHNRIIGTDPDNQRGFTASNIDNASTIEIDHNIVQSVGQGGWGCLTVHRGVISAHDNECTDSEGGLDVNGAYGGTRTITLDNELICPLPGYERLIAENGASLTSVSETNARTCP